MELEAEAWKRAKREAESRHPPLELPASLGSSPEEDARLLLEGDMDKATSARAVKIFLSSTFNDTQSERNYLMEWVWPEIRDICRQKGLQLRVLDFRWGIVDQAVNDHTITKICIDEIVNCQTGSLGPAVIYLGTQRYGWRPLPAAVPRRQLEQILSKVAVPEDRQLVKHWYWLDQNSQLPIPHDPKQPVEHECHYFLRPLNKMIEQLSESEIPDHMADHEFKALQDAGMAIWNEKQAELMRILKGAVLSGAGLSKQELVHWTTCVTEQEMHAGLTKPDRVMCFDREIEDLLSHRDWKDFHKFTNTDDADEMRRLLAKMKELIFSSIEDVGCKHHICKYKTEWAEDGVQLTNRGSQAAYIRQMCADLRLMVLQNVEMMQNQCPTPARADQVVIMREVNHQDRKSVV